MEMLLHVIRFFWFDIKFLPHFNIKMSLFFVVVFRLNQFSFQCKLHEIHFLNISPLKEMFQFLTNDI